MIFIYQNMKSSIRRKKEITIAGVSFYQLRFFMASSLVSLTSGVWKKRQQLTIDEQHGIKNINTQCKESFLTIPKP